MATSQNSATSPPVASRASDASTTIREAHAELRRFLIGQFVPTIPIWADSDDFDSALVYLRELAAAVDKLVLVVGEEVASNAIATVNLGPFRGRVSEALQDALVEIARAASAAEEARHG